MVTPAGYIDINRRFSALHGSVQSEDAAASSYLRGSFAGSTLGWDELLKERLVVILGEPGSGKSWEFRRRSALLGEAGEPAFLIELERLVSGPFAAGIAPDDYARFQQWRRGTATACFFLDSVDESKIRRSADFYAALDKVLAAIGAAAMSRAQVYISSRISEWQPETDLHEVITRFGAAGRPGTPAAENTLFVVQLDPLDRDRVRTFAASRGIAKPELFLAELDNRYAWEFARRPLDVLDLAEFWSVSGRLGTLTEIIEHDVTTKLRETVQRNSHFPLSEERAREGAEALAVATILCMRPQFKVPDDTYKAPEALDAASCLPANWTPAEAAALLSRPLFDSATYGQIRFHHRRIAEYLAACWFRRRMEQGCSTHVLLQQLFQEVRGTVVPRRSLIPVKERANKRYTIPQEEEIDQEQRPDLRAENQNTDPVSIELKWADNWPLPELLERLENQLLGQYLRAHNSRYGIYVLGTDGRKKHWKDLNGRNLGFEEIMQIIVRRARELAETRADVAGLCVVGIDFRVPS